MSHINNGGNGGHPGGNILVKTDERATAPWFAWDGGDAMPMTDDWLWTRSQVSGGDSLGGDGFGILDSSRSVYDWDSWINIPTWSTGSRQVVQNDGMILESLQNITGVGRTYNEAWEAVFDAAGITSTNHFDGRMLDWINQKLGTTYTNLPNSQAALASYYGVTNFSSISILW